MANIKSKIKRAKQAKVAALRNKQAKSLIKTKLRQFNEAIEANESDKAQKVSKEGIRLLDKAASKGIIHKNRAASKKAAITKSLNKIASSTKKTVKSKTKT